MMDASSLLGNWIQRAPGMKDILERYVGKEIGVNANKPFHIDSYLLESVEDLYFSVCQEKSSSRTHIPYHSIIRIIEDQTGGIHVGGLFQQKKDFPLVVKVAHYVTTVPA